MKVCILFISLALTIQLYKCVTNNSRNLQVGEWQAYVDKSHVYSIEKAHSHSRLIHEFLKLCVESFQTFWRQCLQQVKTSVTVTSTEKTSGIRMHQLSAAITHIPWNIPNIWMEQKRYYFI